MANPTYRASGNTAATAGGTSISGVAAPSTTAVGDVLFVYYTGYSAGTFTPTPTLPSGWTLLQSDTQTGAGYTVFGYVASFVATASGGTNFTFGSSLPATTSGYGCVAGIIGFYGQNSTPVDGSAFAVVPNGTTAASPTATASVSNDTILCLYIDNGNTGATPSLPTGLTSAVAFTDSSTGTGIRAGYAALTSSGTSPSYTSTFGETVGPSGGVFGTMFTVLVKGAGTSTNTANGVASSSNGVAGTAPSTLATAGSAGSANGASGTTTDVGLASANGVAFSANSAIGTTASTLTTAGSAGSTNGAFGTTSSGTPGPVVQQVYQASQKWHIGSWSPTTISVTCNQGDSLIVLTNQWNSDAPGPYVPVMSPGSLTTIYDPEATYLGTAEPVFAQALAAFNLAAGTYTITPPNLGGPGGDGDTYVLRVSGATGLRAYGAAEVGGGSTTTGNYTSITATLQSAAQPGDLLVAIGGTDNNTVTTTLVVSALNGWTNAAKQTDGTNSPPSSVDYITATGGAQSVTYTWPDYASPVGEAIILAIIPATAPQADGAASSSNGAAGTAPSTLTTAGSAGSSSGASGTLTVDGTVHANGVSSSPNGAAGTAPSTLTTAGSAGSSSGASGTLHAAQFPADGVASPGQAGAAGSTSSTANATGAGRSDSGASGALQVVQIPANGVALLPNGAAGTTYDVVPFVGVVSFENGAAGTAYTFDPNYYVLDPALDYTVPNP